MPGGPAGLDDPADDELAALAAAGRVEDVEAVLAVLAALELVEDAVGVRTEALGAAETVRGKIVDKLTLIGQFDSGVLDPASSTPGEFDPRLRRTRRFGLLALMQRFSRLINN